MPWPDNGRAGSPRSRRPGSGQYYTATNGTATNGGTVMLPDRGDRQYRARWLLADERYRLGIAALAHEKMPLTRYYRGGLVDVPLDRLLARGRWAA
jgi:hypothetical protein